MGNFQSDEDEEERSQGFVFGGGDFEVEDVLAGVVGDRKGIVKPSFEEGQGDIELGDISDLKDTGIALREGEELFVREGVSKSCGELDFEFLAHGWVSENTRQGDGGLRLSGSQGSVEEFLEIFFAKFRREAEGFADFRVGIDSEKKNRKEAMKDVGQDNRKAIVLDFHRKIVDQRNWKLTHSHFTIPRNLEKTRQPETSQSARSRSRRSQKP